MRRGHFMSVAAGLLCVAAPIACADTQDEQVASIRQALPNKEALQLSGPESSAAGTNSSDAGAAPANAPDATFYAFTRRVRDGVNAITAGVLGTVWYIVNTTPTTKGPDHAVWGPYTDSLEPATWRFRVTRVAEHEYDYVLEGRPKQSSSDQDYRTVLSGVGYSTADPRHGDGHFIVNLDAARALDPVAHPNDSGTVSVTHDLPPTVTETLAPLPREIHVTLAPSTTQEYLEIVSLAREDRTGVVTVEGRADIDASKATLLEDVTVASQWSSAGAGRSDVTLANGDIPSNMSPVTLVECWDTQFKQSYYKDSVGLAAEAGDITACAFAEPVTLAP